MEPPTDEEVEEAIAQYRADVAAAWCGPDRNETLLEFADLADNLLGINNEAAIARLQLGREALTTREIPAHVHKLVPLVKRGGKHPLLSRIPGGGLTLIVVGVLVATGLLIVSIGAFMPGPYLAPTFTAKSFGIGGGPVTEAQILRAADLNGYWFMSTWKGAQLTDLEPGEVAWARILDYGSLNHHEAIVVGTSIDNSTVGPHGQYQILVADTGNGLVAIYFLDACTTNGIIDASPVKDKTKLIHLNRNVTGICSS